MIEFIEDLLLHFSIILVLGFMYNFLFTQRRNIYRNAVFLCSISISLILTMIFPVKIAHELMFDLKFIPFFICFFYIRPSISLVMILMMVMLYGIMGLNIFIILINYGIIFIILSLFKKSYLSGSLRSKLLIGFVVYFLITLTRLGALMNSNNIEQLPYALMFTFVSYIALATSIYIIEMTNFQNKTLYELQKAERYNAISQLAASVAHEIRNPMTTIKGFMQVLLSDNNLTKNQNSFISVSLTELERTQIIINNFLSLAKPNTKHNETIDVSHTLTEIIEFMQPYSHISNIEIESVIQEGLMIKGDKSEFKQLMINLIKNGIEAMPLGGEFSVNALEKNGFILIKIKDHGIGMNKKQIRRLGQPYYSTKDKGTGLGLMISYEIVRRMKGVIEVESQEDVGTTFKILFPI
jgi:two-component system sporulation sensor kinase B